MPNDIVIEQSAEPAAEPAALTEAAAVASAIAATGAASDAEHAAETAAAAAETVAETSEEAAAEATVAAAAATEAVAIDAQVLARIDAIEAKQDRVLALLEDLTREPDPPSGEEPEGEAVLEVREVPPEPAGTETEPQERRAGRRYAKGF